MEKGKNTIKIKRKKKPSEKGTVVTRKRVAHTIVP